jgi:hypothetical protein
MDGVMLRVVPLEKRLWVTWLIMPYNYFLLDAYA